MSGLVVEIPHKRSFANSKVADVNLKAAILGEISMKCKTLLSHIGQPLECWLDQFESDADQVLALKLFSQLRLFDVNDVRAACQQLYRTVLTFDGVTEDNMALSFFGTGKSGGLVTYFFRNSNFLHHNDVVPWSFIGDPRAYEYGPPSRREKPLPRNLVIVDDFLGSGREFVKYSQQLDGAFDKYDKVFYLVFVAYDAGIAYVEEHFPNVTLIVYERHLKCFDDACPLFSDEDKEAMKEMLVRYQPRVYPAEKYGRIASPYGYRDGQALIVFFYNTPSNTLPIFWSVETTDEWGQWHPVFRRFDSYNVVPEAARNLQPKYLYAYDGLQDARDDATPAPMARTPKVNVHTTLAELIFVKDGESVDATVTTTADAATTAADGDHA